MKMTRDTYRSIQRQLRGNIRVAPPPPVESGTRPLAPYVPTIRIPSPMEPLQELGSAVARRRRRSRLSIAGIGGM